VDLDTAVAKVRDQTIPWLRKIEQDGCASDLAALLKAITAAEAKASRVRSALEGLLRAEHINLGDLVYAVREREGLDWEGPAVKAWSAAVVEAEEAVGLRMPPVRPISREE
jgi:hypothetical protein